MSGYVTSSFVHRNTGADLPQPTAAQRYGDPDVALRVRNAVLDLQLSHRSVRKFGPREVTDDELAALVAAAQSAPTSVSGMNSFLYWSQTAAGIFSGAKPPQLWRKVSDSRDDEGGASYVSAVQFAREHLSLM